MNHAGDVTETLEPLMNSDHVKYTWLQQCISVLTYVYLSYITECHFVYVANALLVCLSRHWEGTAFQAKPSWCIYALARKVKLFILS